jgi:DNA adenine methylase
MSFFRYPGGKSKIGKIIINKLLAIINNNKELEYREPFFGGGSIGLNFLKNIPDKNNIWINDYDYGISNLWTSVICFSEELKKRVKNYKPSVESFYELKKDLLLGSDDVLDSGFKKLVIHQISYSGLGTRSGGPLGGKKQSSKYKIDCRWSPDYICKRIDEFNLLFSKYKLKENICTKHDFSKLITDCDKMSLLYLDPPYYLKGGDLYQYSFNVKDHYRLSVLLKNTKHHWILSYDDTPEIREMYYWAKIEEINNINYTIKTSRSKSELLIFPEHSRC